MFKGANYTLELRKIDPVFDFKYDFYEPALKCHFEKKFIDHYYFNEIGFETIGRFKQRLKALLNKKMPYYTQLYKTELAAQDINFLLNKDLKETFIRELDRTDNLTGSNTTTTQDSSYQTGTEKADNQREVNTKTTDKNTTDGTNKTTTEEKISNIADGVASASLADNYLTNVAENVNNGTNKTVVTGEGTNGTTDKTIVIGTNEATIQNAGSLNGNNKEDRTGKEQEKTELISQGNIGITSSAELLEKWRSVLINIDELIIEDCQDLFMGIF